MKCRVIRAFTYMDLPYKAGDEVDATAFENAELLIRTRFLAPVDVDLPVDVLPLPKKRGRRMSE